MALLQLIYAPNPIFSAKAEPVSKVDSEIQKLIDDMFDTMEFEKAVGIGANMVGVLKRVIVVNLKPDGVDQKYCMVNPEIIWKSDETQTHEEASICFPAISAQITRPKAIKVEYLDYDGKPQTLEAQDFLATVIQHEMDYLDGVIYLDHLSKLKRDSLLKKMNKYIKLHPPHIHSASCNH